MSTNRTQCNMGKAAVRQQLSIPVFDFNTKELHSMVDEKYTKYMNLYIIIHMDYGERVGALIAIGVLLSLFFLRILCCLCYTPYDNFQVAPTEEEDV